MFLKKRSTLCNDLAYILAWSYFVHFYYFFITTWCLILPITVSLLKLDFVLVSWRVLFFFLLVSKHTVKKRGKETECHLSFQCLQSFYLFLQMAPFALTVFVATSISLSCFMVHLIILVCIKKRTINSATDFKSNVGRKKKEIAIPPPQTLKYVEINSQSCYLNNVIRSFNLFLYWACYDIESFIHILIAFLIEKQTGIFQPHFQDHYQIYIFFSMWKKITEISFVSD